jgi:hypothetical protein
MEFNFGDFVQGLDTRFRRSLPVATRRAYAPALPQGQIFSSVKPPVTVAGSIAGLTSTALGRAALIPAAYEQARIVFNPKDNIVTQLVNLGSGLNNLVQGRPYLEGRTLRLPPDAPRLSQANPPGFDPSKPVTLADLRKTLQETGPLVSAPVEPFSRLSPEDRDYEQKKSRVAQLAAQDELAKKYNVADLTKAYNTASTPEEKEKIGLQIWATTNPQLAAKLKPGQLGYEETQAVAASQSPLGGAMQAAGNMQFSDKISFGGVPATSFGVGVDIQTPITGYTVPNVPQFGTTESFKGTTPGGISFMEAAELFKGQLPGQADAAVLKKIFEQGLKK